MKFYRTTHRFSVNKVFVAVVFSSLIGFFFCGYLLHSEAVREAGSDYFNMLVQQSNIDGGIDKLSLLDNRTVMRSSQVKSVYGLRAFEYCNTARDSVVGDEGIAPAGFALRSVYVVIRHGDRTPMGALFGLPLPVPTAGCQIKSQRGLHKPILHDFAEHMRKQKPVHAGAFSGWSTYPDSPRCRPAQLTVQGTLQLLLSGLALKKAYVTEWNLFIDGFLPADNLDVQCTRLPRTYQSAVAFLYGALPSFNLSEIAFSPVRNDYFCRGSGLPDACCRFLERVKVGMESGGGDPSSRSGGRSMVNHTGLMLTLSDLFKVDRSDLPPIADVVDFLQGYACHNLPFPCCSRHGYMPAKLLDQLWSLLDVDGAARVTSSAFQRHSRIASHFLLSDIANKMVRVSRNRSALRLSLYSGHDTTLTPLLTALGIDDGRWPHYAFRIVFELYGERTSPRRHFIRVVKDGLDVTAAVPFCRGNGALGGLCPLRLFDRFVRNGDGGEGVGMGNVSDIRTLCGVV